jgi:hypothetical protein
LKKKFKYKNANKQKGIILRGLEGGPSTFRVYKTKDSFKDYEILNSDIMVQILDDDAELVESIDGKELYLDYSRKTLGKKN